MLRLDKNLLPTRNRLATLSTAELDKLSELKNIIRNRLVHLDVEDQVEELPIRATIIDPFRAWKPPILMP